MVQEIIVDPEEFIVISFSGKRGTITMKNNSITGKCYKIKTTKPNDYTVKPSMGVIDALAKTTVTIIAETDIMINVDHRFLVEIYEFDTSQTITEMKEYLKKPQTEPVFTKVLGIMIGQDTYIWNFPKLQGPRDVIHVLCMFILAILFLKLIFSMIILK